MSDHLTRVLLEASLKVVPAKVKSFHEIHQAMLALKADCEAFHRANHKTNYASDAVSGLCDLLSDHSLEFEAEIPTASPPAEYSRAGGHGSV
jgi:hypothetical protein